jgi:hypothetical protein
MHSLCCHTHLSVASEGEVLAQWVSLEAVVCEDASQVWVAAEEHSKHVPHLTLKPVGSRIDGAQAGHCCHLVTTHLEGGEDSREADRDMNEGKASRGKRETAWKPGKWQDRIRPQYGWGLEPLVQTGCQIACLLISNISSNQKHSFGTSPCWPWPHLDPDPVVPAGAEQVIHHLKAGGTLGEVHSSDIDETLELGVHVVTQEPGARGATRRNSGDAEGAGSSTKLRQQPT